MFIIPPFSIFAPLVSTGQVLAGRRLTFIGFAVESLQLRVDFLVNKVGVAPESIGQVVTRLPQVRSGPGTGRQSRKGRRHLAGRVPRDSASVIWTGRAFFIAFAL